MKSNSLKLISLNAGGHKYIDLIIPFLKKQSPDVVCLQEIYKINTEKIATQLSANLSFAPLRLRQSNDKDGDFIEWGNATISRLLFLKVDNFYYEGAENEPLDRFINGNIKHNKRSLLITDFEHENVMFKVAHTHFAGWMPGTDRTKQLTQFEKLYNFLQKQVDLILCGDLNIARGDDELYKKLVKLFHDNIPENINSTLDSELHPNKDLEIVIDYIFTTSKYKVEKVELHDGVSDHKAVVAKIKKDI